MVKRLQVMQPLVLEKRNELDLLFYCHIIRLTLPLLYGDLLGIILPPYDGRNRKSSGRAKSSKGFHNIFIPILLI